MSDIMPDIMANDKVACGLAGGQLAPALQGVEGSTVADVGHEATVALAKPCKGVSGRCGQT